MSVKPPSIDVLEAVRERTGAGARGRVPEHCCAVGRRVGWHALVHGVVRRDPAPGAAGCAPEGGCC